jgi:hypothetical protein
MFHLAQLVVLFTLGAVLLLLPHPAPGQGRVVMGTFGVVYAMEVSHVGFGDVVRAGVTFCEYTAGHVPKSSVTILCMASDSMNDEVCEYAG